MNRKRFPYPLMVVVALAAAGPIAAELPQYGATAASVTDADPITEGWNCNPAVGSIVPSNRCWFGARQGNGAPYADAPAAAFTTGIGWPAPKFNNPVTGAFILWLGGAADHGGQNVTGPGKLYTGGDNFVIYRTPNTHAGRRAHAGTVTLMNDMVRPDGIHIANGSTINFTAASGSNKAFWVPGGFQYEPDFGTWLIMSEATYPTGHPATITNTTIYIGESFDGVKNYNWRPIVNFRFTPTNPTGPAHYGIRWTPQGRSFVKDPNNNFRWIGITGWSNWESGALSGRGTAPAMIDFSEAGNPAIGIQYCVGFQNGLNMSDPRAREGFNNQYDFYCYREAEKHIPRKTRPLTTTGAEALPAVMFGNFGSVALVNNGAGFHGEIWSSDSGVTPLWCADPANRAQFGYTSESQCALARQSCGSFLNSGQYLTNRTGIGASTDKLVYREWDPVTLWRVGAQSNKKELISNAVLAWPAPHGDHISASYGPSRYDWPQETAVGRNLLYVNRKRSICFEPVEWGNLKYGGVGSSVLILQEQ